MDDQPIINRELLDFIKSRKSVRNFIFQKIDDEIIREILECGRWAPSGLNNQPWKVFVVTTPVVKRMLSECTKYGEIIENAYADIVVFLDIDKSYNRVKDLQGVGAFMQNILLGIHSMNLGGVWLGEILNKKEDVNKIFKLDEEKFELMGVIAFGMIDKVLDEKHGGQRERSALEEFTEWL